jgi:hypothetical protein
MMVRVRGWSMPAETTWEFADIHATRQGETLQAIAEEHGLETTDLIVRHPANRALFPALGQVNPVVTPLNSETFELLVVPWPQSALRAYIDEAERQIRSTEARAAARIEVLLEDERELARFHLHVDAVAALATFGVSSVRHIQKLGELWRARRGVLGVRDLVNFLFRFGWNRRDFVALGLPEPDPLERDLSFYLRHVFGIVSPTWLASYLVSRIEGDRDIFAFGPHAVTRKAAIETHERARREIARLHGKILAAERQLDADFYRGRPLFP